jgi:hypothetical protein
LISPYFVRSLRYEQFLNEKIVAKLAIGGFLCQVYATLFRP